MGERGISDADVVRAYATRQQPPLPGDIGAVVYRGLATNGQWLRLVCSTYTSGVFVISLYWEDEGR